jgi:hypothetical protein
MVQFFLPEKKYKDVMGTVKFKGFIEALHIEFFYFIQSNELRGC